MPIDFTALNAEVERDNTVNGSASTLITRLVDIIAAANVEGQAAVDAVLAQIRANNDSLAAAVEANTPSA